MLKLHTILVAYSTVVLIGSARSCLELDILKLYLHKQGSNYGQGLHIGGLLTGGTSNVIS